MTPTDAPPDPLLDTAAFLRLMIVCLARCLRQATPNDLGASRGAFLAHLERDGALPPRELARREGIQRPSATRLLETLHGLGLVMAEPDPHDARSHQLRLTPAGHAHLQDQRAQRNAHMERLLAALEPQALDTLLAAVRIIDRAVLQADPWAVED